MGTAREFHQTRRAKAPRAQRAANSRMDLV
jgi:hypothetical protein